MSGAGTVQQKAPTSEFTAEKIHKWRDVLALSLLPMPADTYLRAIVDGMPRSPQDHPTLKAFDANERIVTQYANVDYPTSSYAEGKIEFIRGSLRLRVELPRPRTRFDRIMSLPVTRKTDGIKLADAIQEFARDAATYSARAAFTAGLWTAFEKPPKVPNPAEFEVLATEALADAFMTMDANYDSVPPAQSMRINNFKPQPIQFGTYVLSPLVSSAADFFADNRDDCRQWQAYARILGYGDAEDLLNAYFKGNLISEWDTIFYTDIAPLVVEKILSSLGLSEFDIDASTETKYRGSGERSLRVALTGRTTKQRNQLPLELQLSAGKGIFEDLKNYVTFVAEDLTITYSTAHYNGVLFSGTLNDDLFDEVTLYIPVSAAEKRNPRKEDAYLVHKLIEHLNANVEYYNQALWYDLGPQRRHMLLDGFDIQTYTNDGLPADRRSLATVVKNELAAVVGNSLVFPVAPGYRVSPSFIIAATAAGQEKVSLLDHYQPLTPIEPYRISVPTSGVFAEAVQGACNACEKIEKDRLQDWSKFPIVDEPTPIQPIVTPTLTASDWNPNLKDFAAPIVNVQNAPTLPAPGAGLAGLSELLGKAGVFNDITGLDANQQNAIRTYLSNQENAKAFADMAKEMAMQQHNTQNSDKIREQINAAKGTGDITKQEAGQLTRDLLQTQIDGGASKRAELDKATREEFPSIAKAGVNAINRGLGDVATSISHPDGSVETVTVKNAAAGEQVAEPNSADWESEESLSRPQFSVEGNLLSLWNYPVGKAELATEHRDALVEFLKLEIGRAQLEAPSERANSRPITIVGAASNTGDSASNDTLSRRRAQNVAAFLRDKGIDQRQMDVLWFGDSQPEEYGHARIESARNRRVYVIREPRSEVLPLPPIELIDSPPNERTPKPAPVWTSTGLTYERVFSFSFPTYRSPNVIVTGSVEVSIIGKVTIKGNGITGGMALKPAGGVSAKAETEIAEHVKAKVAIDLKGDGPGVVAKAGLARSGWWGDPEIGLQAKMPWIYMSLTVIDKPFLGFDVEEFHVSGRYTLKGKIEFAPGPALLPRISAGLVPIALYTMILGATVEGIDAAAAEQLRFACLIAGREGVAARVAWELAALGGSDVKTAFNNRLEEWKRTECLKEFYAGVNGINNSLRVPGARQNLQTKWMKKYTPDSASDFQTLMKRVFEDVGGVDSRGTLEEALSRAVTQ